MVAKMYLPGGANNKIESEEINKMNLNPTILKGKRTTIMELPYLQGTFECPYE